MWVFLALGSALLLGFYDVFKKVSLKGNAVIPVLAGSIFISAVLFAFCIVLSEMYPERMKAIAFYVPSIDWRTHLSIFIKASIVLGSWISAYFGMKYVPLTIFSPIRATQPIWTVLGAFIFFSERLTLTQIIGITITITAFYLFSLIGVKEGFSLKSNKWIWLIILATLLGSASGLYDKHLMINYNRVAVQVYSSIYQALIMLIILFAIWYPQRHKNTPFQWRWSIIGIALFLILADYLYFWALSQEGALISIISTIRRSGAVIPFLYGAILLHEKNLRRKSVLLTFILFGVFLLVI
jgi:transporter family protein